MSIESKLAFLQETKAANAQTKAYQRLQLLFDTLNPAIYHLNPILSR